MSGFAPTTAAARLTAALELPVAAPLSLLATAVIGSAVDDSRAGIAHVLIAASWLQIADVDPRLLESEGVEVDNAINIRWQFG